MSKLFEEKLGKLNVCSDNYKMQQFVAYYKILIEWNQFMNLTAITEYEEVNEKHFIDSLTLINTIDLQKVDSLIDVGTGAGFPGIPLKIMFPHLKVTLLDSLKKRINFLDTVIQNLNLSGIETIHGRAEDFSRQEEHREKYDLAVSRAVANLATLSEYCIPYVKVGGHFIAYKSGAIEDEVNGAKRSIMMLGGELEDVIKFQLPGTQTNRSLIKIKKRNQTKDKYPRKAGLPAKEPLI